MSDWIHTLSYPGLWEASAAPARRTVFVVRPAECEASGKLSVVGKRRAEAMAAMLADAEVKQIFACLGCAAGEMAALLARKLGLSTSVFSADDVESMALLVNWGPGNALVVTDAQSLPKVLKEFCGKSAPEVAEDEVDFLYSITAKRAVKLRYGVGGGAS